MKITEARAIAQNYGVLPEVGEALMVKVFDYATCTSDFWWDIEPVAEEYYPSNKTWIIVNAINNAEFSKNPAEVAGMPPEFNQELNTYEGDWDNSYDCFINKYAADCPCRHFGAIQEEIERQVFNTINQGEIPEGLEEKAQACEAAAVSLSFPKEAGRELFLGFLQDRIQKWNEDKFLAWVCWMDHKYGKSTAGLYGVVSDITQGNQTAIAA